jgi:hypothetical protein
VLRNRRQTPALTCTLPTFNAPILKLLRDAAKLKSPGIVSTLICGVQR